MPDLTVVIPWRDVGCVHRQRSLRWCLDRWRELGRTVRLGLSVGDPWVKADAVDHGVAPLPDDTVVVIADADVWCDGIDAAIDAVTSGSHRWAKPHRLVHRLDDATTAATHDGGPLGGKLDQAPYVGKTGGGMLVTTAATYREIPLDPRFQGWGQEDESWGLALQCLAGPGFLGDAHLWHLWHPPQPRLSRVIGSRAGQQLHARYKAVSSTPAAMRSLIAEIATERPPRTP